MVLVLTAFCQLEYPRGKSGLHRVGRQVTPGGREPTESAAESKPPSDLFWIKVRVKGCGKSTPRYW